MVEIELTQGYKTIVDEIDKDLAAYRWRTLNTGNRHVYAVRGGGKRQSILLHRIILERKIGRGIPGNMKTDHVNRDSLDNRRDNLRLATHSQNLANSKRKADATSPYRGVRQAASGRWRAQISVNGKNLHPGTYLSPEEAALAWNRSALLYHGDFAQLNEIGE